MHDYTLCFFAFSISTKVSLSGLFARIVMCFVSLFQHTTWMTVNSVDGQIHMTTILTTPYQMVVC